MSDIREWLEELGLGQYADAEAHATVFGKCLVTVTKLFLYRYRRLDRADRAQKEGQHAVARHIDDPAAMRGNMLLEHRAAGVQRGHGGPLVGLHEPGIAGNVCRENGGQPLIRVCVRHG